MNPTLFIMAAGMGSRYGGLKQLDGVGPSGETIMDYSVYDAVKAGFGKIVFVIRHDFEKEFTEKVLSKYSYTVNTEIVFQETDKLPEGFKANPERTKPWGTNHAVLMGQEKINEPFAVINADDYYGADSFKVLADFLKSVENKKNSYCMIAFKIGNTLSENGGVSRGLCEVDVKGNLINVRELHNIEKKDGQISYDKGGEREILDPESVVSMNMWGFTPDYFDYSVKEFIDFLKKNHNDLKAEFYIPSVVNSLIQSKIVELKVLETTSKWFGVTYAGDREKTVETLSEMTKAGKYPTPLFSI